jgi:hypothetical protein
MDGRTPLRRHDLISFGSRAAPPPQHLSAPPPQHLSASPPQHLPVAPPQYLSRASPQHLIVILRAYTAQIKHETPMIRRRGKLMEGKGQRFIEHDRRL